MNGKTMIGMLMGIFMLMMVSFVSATTMQTNVNDPLFITTVCAGQDSSVDISIYSGTTMNPDNLIVPRQAMSKDSDQDFSFYVEGFNTVGTYTAFMECIYGGGFAVQYQTTINVFDLANLVTTTTLKDYQYQANLFYDTYFKSNPTKDKTIRFDLGADTITFQPKELYLINAQDTKHQDVGKPSDKSVGTPVRNTFVYENMYGQGRDLKYLIITQYVKEELVFNDPSTLPVAKDDLGVDPQIELNSMMTTTTKRFIVDGKLWDMKNEVTTRNTILIEDAQNNTIYRLEIPVAFDSNHERIVGTYTLKKDADKVKVAVKFDYAWFKDPARAFPIILDPTIDTPDGTGVFDNSVPEIVIADFTIPANEPYLITQTIVKGNTTIIDAECELDIQDAITGVHIVNFRSFFNNWDGTYQFLWGMPNTAENPVVGNYTIDQYCWRGETLLLNKIYSVSAIVVN